MKIIFICGSVEQGRDGVGDYTRRLCATLYKLGYSAGIIAINDSSIAKPEAVTQKEDDINVEVYRLPSTLARKERYKLAQEWIEEKNPKWLSLQFVPYSFSEKGIPFSLASELKGLGKGRNWHIMFHELWIGMDDSSSIKEKIIGLLQRLIIKSMVFQLKPITIHTQTHIYKHHLKDLGYQSSLLPLFSNIPVYKEHKNSEKDDITFVIFGGIHANAPIKKFIKEASEYFSKIGKTISLITIGRNGKELDNWIHIWNSSGLSTKQMGEQSKEVISTTLSNADYGICTTPLVLSEKSGSVAAMHLHNLPVICVARNWNTGVQISKKEISVMNYQEGNFHNMIVNANTIHKVDNSANKIAKLLLDSLKINIDG